MIIRIDGSITPATARRVLDQLRAASPRESISFRIDSTGGDAVAALEIADAIARERRGRTVEATVERFAASAATVILCACAPRRIAASALLMIHSPECVSDPPRLCQAPEGRAFVGSIMGRMLDVYHAATGIGRWRLRGMIAEDRWIDAGEALRLGFATELVGEDHGWTRAFAVASGRTGPGVRSSSKRFS